jgi:hypothetical protein
MFVGKAKSIPAHIRHGWEDLPGTNTAVYFVSSSLTKKKVS